jgi:HEPN domain-containing protein
MKEMAAGDKDVRKFRRAAEQRLKAAVLLLKHGFYLESTYLAGYCVECALKSLILRRTPLRRRATMLNLLTKAGAKGHDIEYLRRLLSGPPVNCQPPETICRLLRRAASWTTDLRYETGTIPVGKAQQFIEAARGLWEWTDRS